MTIGYRAGSTVIYLKTKKRRIAQLTESEAAIAIVRTLP